MSAECWLPEAGVSDGDVQSGKSGAKPPSSVDIPATPPSHKHDLGSRLSKTPRTRPISDGTKQAEDPGSNRQRVMRRARTWGSCEASRKAAQLRPTRRHDTTRHQVPFPVNQPPPSDDPEEVHYLALWKVANPNNPNHWTAHSYSASNTHGMMPRLSFPMWCCLVSCSVIRAPLFPTPRLRTRQMELVQQRFYALVLHAPSYLI